MGRANHLPVVWIHANYDDSLVNEPFKEKFSLHHPSDELLIIRPCVTDWGRELIAPLKRFQIETEKHVEKHSFNGFHQTDLKEYLQTNHVETVVLVGVSTAVCVESTARSAFFEGFHVVIVEDAVNDVETFHKNSLQIMEMCFSSVIPFTDLLQQSHTEL